MRTINSKISLFDATTEEMEISGVTAKEFENMQEMLSRFLSKDVNILSNAGDGENLYIVVLVSNELNTLINTCRRVDGMKTLTLNELQLVHNTIRNAALNCNDITGSLAELHNLCCAYLKYVKSKLGNISTCDH